MVAHTPNIQQRGDVLPDRSSFSTPERSSSYWQIKQSSCERIEQSRAAGLIRQRCEETTLESSNTAQKSREQIKQTASAELS
jgi:hypothetical protein